MNYTDRDAARLAELAMLVAWERFRPRLEDARSRLSSAGRHESPPVDDVLVIFRAILFGAIFELTDDGLEFMIGDRSSVQEFVGLDPMDEPPTARSLWLHRACWTRTGVMAEFAAAVDGRWRRAGYGARGLHSLLETLPVRVGWIVDAQHPLPGAQDPLPGAQDPLHVFDVDGAVEVDAREAVARLTRAASRMAACCQVLVYSRRLPEDEPVEAADLIAAVLPAAPLVLSGDANEDEASAVAARALREGRHVVTHGTGDGLFEQRRACGSLLAAVGELFERPVEILVAGCALVGSVAPVVDGLRSHGHRVAVIRDAIVTSCREPEEEVTMAWAGKGAVLSLHDLRQPLHDSRQVSFADIEIAGAYRRLDALMNTSSEFTPLARLDEAVPWELFRARLEVSRRNPQEARGRREPLAICDAVVVFKSLLLGAIHGLSDDVLTFLLHDRLTFRRFAGIGVTDRLPTERQLRIHRKRWTKAGVLVELAANVEGRWAQLGYRLQGMRDLMRVSSLGSEDGNAKRGRAEPPERESGPRTPPKQGTGRKRLSRRQRRKRRRKKRK